MSIKYAISCLAVVLSIGWMLTGCDESPKKSMQPSVVTTAHPWLHKEFWEEIADDDSNDYNFECVFGMPFVRRDGYPPARMHRYHNDASKLENHIWSIMWEVCGDMSYDEWRDRK